ncbi:MAG: tetratricopeptide repeat protein [Thermoanaerobaculia bacterium]|nr:tetratricopeptide repeat protein [Thermoanaerobaculia bacterium]
MAYFVVLLVAGFVAVAITATPRLEVALEEQLELAAERPYDAAVQNDLGNLLLLAGRLDAAGESYLRALEIDGTYARARFNLALLEQQIGHHQEALDHLQLLLDQDPTHAWAHYQSGVSHQELDHRKDALEHYAHAFGLDPTLSFAENNPHIIDNTMVTEALLLSTRYGATASRSVARQYDDAERIAHLMLEPDLTTEDEEGEGTDGAERLSGGEPGEQPVQHTIRSSNGVVFDESDEDSAQQNEDRVITEDDLDTGSRVGGAVGVPTARSRPDVRRNRPTPRGRGVDLRSPTRRDAQPERADDERYRPSRRSSASLELKLLPEDDTAKEGVG